MYPVLTIMYTDYLPEQPAEYSTRKIQRIHYLSRYRYSGFRGYCGIQGRVAKSPLLLVGTRSQFNLLVPTYLCRDLAPGPPTPPKPNDRRAIMADVSRLMQVSIRIQVLTLL